MIGNPGSGKSTFAKRLGEKLKREVIHLDNLYCLPGGTTSGGRDWEKIQERLVKEKRWIIEGMYLRTLDIRLKRADMVIFLNIPNWLALYRAIKRRLMAPFRKRTGAPEFYEERLPINIVKKIIVFPRHKVLERIKAFDKNKTIVVLHSNLEIDTFLGSL